MHPITPLFVLLAWSLVTTALPWSLYLPTLNATFPKFIPGSPWFDPIAKVINATKPLPIDIIYNQTGLSPIAKIINASKPFPFDIFPNTTGLRPIDFFNKTGRRPTYILPNTTGWLPIDILWNKTKLGPNQIFPNSTQWLPFNNSRNTTKWLSIVEPPPSNVHKRRSFNDAAQCTSVRIDNHIDSADPITVKNSFCSAANLVLVICNYFDRFGVSQEALVRQPCEDYEWCVEDGDSTASRAWCASAENLLVWSAPDDTESQGSARWVGTTKKTWKIRELYWDMMTGAPKNVSNTTFILTTERHTRTELDNLPYAETPPQALDYGQGWNIFVNPGGTGMTGIVTYALGVSA